MGYVFDHYALLYMLEQFPRTIAEQLWNRFEDCCKDETIVSQREAQKCLENEAVEPASLEWSKKNAKLFKLISTDEAQLLGTMMENREFEFLNIPHRAERRMPEALPFILAMAKLQNRKYVYRKNTNTDFANKIRAICESYEIETVEVEECLLALR